MKFPIRALASVYSFAITTSAFATASAPSSRRAFGVNSFSRLLVGETSRRCWNQSPTGTSTRALQMSASPSELVKDAIASNDVVVFSKTYCPYCTATKSLFEDLKVKAKVIELDMVDDGNSIQSALLDLTGQRTVPSVFIKGQHLGGNDKTQAANKSGKLQELLKSKSSK